MILNISPYIEDIQAYFHAERKDNDMLFITSEHADFRDLTLPLKTLKLLYFKDLIENYSLCHPIISFSLVEHWNLHNADLHYNSVHKKENTYTYIYLIDKQQNTF